MKKLNARRARKCALFLLIGAATLVVGNGCESPLKASFQPKTLDASFFDASSLGSPDATPTPNPSPGPSPSATPTPTPGPTASPSPTPTPGFSDSPNASAKAKAFMASLGFGINIERARILNIGDFASGTQSFSYLKSLGFTHVRLFHPYRPTLDMGGRPTKASIEPFLNTVSNANAVGLKVLLDLLDVMGEEDFAGGHRATVDSFIDMASKEIAARNFDANMVAIGTANEWSAGGSNCWVDGQTGSNQAHNSHRRRLLAIMRANLPNHILISGPSCWKLFSQLWASDFELSDPNVIYDVHAYDYGAKDPNRWAYINSQTLAWSRAHGDALVVFGESGFGGIDEGSPHRHGEWPTAIDAIAQSLRPLKPMFWTITNNGGGHADWQMNSDPAQPYLYPDIEAAVKRATGAP